MLSFIAEDWFKITGHGWVATGPYQGVQVYPSELTGKQVVIDGKVYVIKAVESFQRPMGIVQNDNIGLLIGDREPFELEVVEWIKIKGRGRLVNVAKDRRPSQLGNLVGEIVILDSERYFVEDHLFDGMTRLENDFYRGDNLLVTKVKEK